MKKILKYSAIVVIIAITYIVYSNYPRLNIITGFSAKNVCSCTFEAGRSQKSVEEGDNNFSTVFYAKNVVNVKKKSVTSTVFGLKKRKAVYKKGIGCVLLPENASEERIAKQIPRRKLQQNNLPYPYGDEVQKDTVFANVNYKQLKEAVENAFDSQENGIKKTRAVLVVYKNHIIAEKYAEGFTKDTKLLGWSMTKSISNAILGILEKQGRIKVQQSNLFSEWENDERSKITLNNLLQMNSGLAWDENYNTMSDVTRMLFLDADMSNTQLQKPLAGKPNESWNYSSGTTNLLSGFIRNQFNSHQEYLDFWYSELIDKIGMNSMIIETDVKGNYVSSSYGWATARDWAKFGLLYLHKGNWNGVQLLNESWIDYTVTPTNTSNGQYGAQFWLNAGGVYPNVPKDLFSCNGYQGQRVFIIPSKDIVIVRMGLSESPSFNFDTFLSNILKSIN